MSDAAGEAVRLTVTEEQSDEDGRVCLTDDVRSELGVLTGDRVLVRGENNTITVRVWYPEALDDLDNSMLPLTQSQQQELGVGEGDEVTVMPNSGVAGDVFSADGGAAATNGGDLSSLDGSSPAAGAAASSDDTDGSVEAQQPVSDISYDDVGGLDEELEEIREAIELPLQKPDLFDDLGIDPPKGVLMYGPPGTGKTLIAKAIANEVDARFFHINGPEIMSKYKGESEKKLRDIFTEARQEGDAIVFFDEIDSFASEREDGDESDNRVVSQLLSLMDGMDSEENVVVIGSTNRADSLDPALRRGGRFDREVEIGVPGEVGREEIFDIHAGDMPLADDVTIPDLAQRTHGFVGADIAAVCREAAMETLRRCKTDDGEYDDADDKSVNESDFEDALARVEPSAMREFVAEAPDTDFDDVGGLTEAKTALRRNIEWPLEHGDLFEEANTDPAPGVMLHGESGTGKTLMARALAGESEVNFIHVNSTELIDKYVGESEKAVREVFQRARQASPSIVFLDDIGSVASQYDDSDVTNRVVSQINTELDAIRDEPNITVVAATDDIDAIDPKLIATGRFEEQVELTPPTAEERVEIFEIHAEGKPIADDVDVEELAVGMEGATGADIEAAVREASMAAIEEALEAGDDVEITAEHFNEAIESAIGN